MVPLSQNVVPLLLIILAFRLGVKYLCNACYEMHTIVKRLEIISYVISKF